MNSTQCFPCERFFLRLLKQHATIYWMDMEKIYFIIQFFPVRRILCCRVCMCVFFLQEENCWWFLFSFLKHWETTYFPYQCNTEEMQLTDYRKQKLVPWISLVFLGTFLGVSIDWTRWPDGSLKLEFSTDCSNWYFRHLIFWYNCIQWRRKSARIITRFHFVQQGSQCVENEIFCFCLRFFEVISNDWPKLTFT